jgi:clan AA aspartic protease
MGTFQVTIEIGDPQGARFVPISALVDSGASHTVVPRSVLERLGLKPEERWPFQLADGRQAEYDVAQTQVRINGRSRFTIVVFGDEGVSLLGAATLEVFRLGIDPVGRRLVPVPGLLMAVTQL